ncbi:hypothetical protein Hamer_G030179, partial [Homarus americanus]
CSRGTTTSCSMPLSPTSATPVRSWRPRFFLQKDGQDTRDVRTPEGGQGHRTGASGPSSPGDRGVTLEWCCQDGGHRPAADPSLAPSTTLAALKKLRRRPTSDPCSTSSLAKQSRRVSPLLSCRGGLLGRREPSSTMPLTRHDDLRVAGEVQQHEELVSRSWRQLLITALGAPGL